MERGKIPALRPLATRLRARPLAVAALVLVVAESLLALVGARSPLLSAACLIVAPGLAFAPLLPEAVRTRLVATLAAAPALALGVAAVALVSLSAAGVELTGVSIRLLLLALVTAGFLLPGEEPALSVPREGRWAALGLLLAVAVGALLQGRVVAGYPVPGNDWAKYLLYADEIRRQGSLLIDNPFWMLGVPFRDDPGVPALYGSLIVMTGRPPALLAHGIWVLAGLQVLAVYALVRAYWSELAGVLAAAFWAVLPIDHTILGWHGLANAAALVLFPLVLAYLAGLFTGGLGRRASVGLGITLVGLASIHRLSFLTAIGAIGITLAVACFTSARGRALRGLALAGVAALACCPLVAYDLIERNRTFGGTLDYTNYLDSKIDWELVLRDVGLPFAVVALLGVGLALGWIRRDRRLVPILACLAAVLALGYAWIVHVPNVYVRMAYFLPLALAPLAGVLLAWVPWRRAGAVLAVVVLALTAVAAWDQAPRVKRFYAFANDASLRGLDRVARSVRPDEVVVTDRCWSFLGTWLVRARTLPAIEPADIQPKAELSRARQGREILDGTPEGRRLARALGVRFILVDPSCVDSRGRPTRPPRIGRPEFLSDRLVVLRL